MKKTLSILTFMVMTVTLLAQTTLTFVGRDRTGNDYVRLSSVSVYDLDQLWHQIIEYPDTTLVLYVNGTVGVETVHAPSLQMQNNPNPFDGATDVILCTPYAGDVTMEIADVNGRAVVGANDYSPLPTGTHQFHLTLSAPGTYVLTARQNGRTVSVKMVNAGNGGGDGIEYMGFVETPYYDVSTILTPKSNSRGDGHYPFHNWDRMRYTGYAVVDDVEIESETVEKAQNGSETIPLKFDVARPEVVTNDATNVAATAAMLHGEVTADNNASVTERGFCYGTAPNPTYSSSPRVEAGDGLGTFDATINGLAAATTYYTRAYAKNVVGVSYGTSKAFRTNDTLPEVVTTEPEQVTATSFVSGGEVLTANGAAVTVRGICWNTTGAPTIADSHTTQTGGLGSFTSNVTGLTCGTTYYVRAYATNSVGTAYGEEYSVTTTQELAQVVTSNVSSITDNTAVCSGEVIYDGCSEVTARGVCWNTTGAPTLDDSYTTDGNGLGDFTSQLSGLNYATTYYVRAYATNGVGTAYGEELSFTTNPILPTVTTMEVTDVMATTFVCGGDVTNDGGAEFTARGICWSTEPNPTIADSYTIDGSGVGAFTSTATGLTCGATYYVRAYATNSAGTAYGEEYSVTTLPQSIPEVRLAMSNIYNGLNIATQAEVLTENCSAVTERGICWGLAPSPTINVNHTNNGNGMGIFSDTLTGLETATTYYIRAYATNELGTAYSEEESITTPDYPTVTTTSITDITSSTATSGGNIINDGGALVTSRGVCWSTSHNPTISDSHTTDGTGTGSFTSSITGLEAVTTYYVRAYATNNVGTSYGNELTFTTEQQCGTFTLTDCDGNTYNTVQIGSQCWMKENLCTTKYADGTPIEQGSSSSYDVAYWHYPHYSSSNQTIYGLLYNWPAVMHGATSSDANPSGVQGVCPMGWHVPSDAEWKQMEMMVGMSQSDADVEDTWGYRGDIAAMLSDNIGWTSSSIANAAGNLSAPDRNSSGFSALPAGQHYPGGYANFGTCANFWSATESSSSGAWMRYLYYNNAAVSRDGIDRHYFYSVRCIRDDKSFCSTEVISNITDFSAECGGEVIAENAATVTARGVCWSIFPHPTIDDNHTIDGSGLGSFSSVLVDLDSSTMYYVRAYATNSVGTSYGEEMCFVTLGNACQGDTTLTDYDGNTYNTVQIGSQCWMKENLRTTKYADGTAISHGDSSSITMAYFYNSNNVINLGLLYNWKAVMGDASSSSANPSGVQGVCPTGWHVPSNAEWTQLTDYVSSQSQYQCNSTSGNIGKALASNSYWDYSNIACAVGSEVGYLSNSNNATGFSAMPAGRFINGSISLFCRSACFGSATECDSSNARQIHLEYNQTGVSCGPFSKTFGVSVRCLRD